ncbi:DUF1684 domain-containing protein [Microbacterium sp. BWT-B31]|uniref:DUF1684 domain-containing protein n=1 Tax=Microbacterium sp. BWT-B31 TaxID=3232072 RepID=UPI0035282905
MIDDYAVWQKARDRAVWAPRGLASLAATDWLDATPRPAAAAPGLWHTDGLAAIGSGEGLPGTVALAPGDALAIGDLELRGFARDGALALRVFDPQAAARRGISHIVRAAYDPALVAPAVFSRTPTHEAAESVDGHRADTTYDGVVSFALGGADLGLTLDVLDDGSLFAAFSDATSGSESYRFRFLRIAAPAADGTTTVDLNRAYLPPCAFSDHYVCVFPPAGNRWTVPVRGGELVVR